MVLGAGVDEVFSYGGVKLEQVRDLVHGAIFTRDAKNLRHTAIFIGGSDVAAAGTAGTPGVSQVVARVW